MTIISGTTDSIAVYCTSNFLKLKLNETLPNLKSFEATETPEMITSGHMVGWNLMKVISQDEGSLYTNQLGPCIAVFGKAYNTSAQKTYLGLTHIFSSEDGIPAALKMLNTLKEKTHNAAIQVFIAGGYKAQGVTCAMLTFLIEQMKDVKVVENLFGVAEKNFWAADAEMIYSGTVGLSQAGFDSNLRPFMIIDALLTGYTGDYTNLKMLED